MEKQVFAAHVGGEAVSKDAGIKGKHYSGCREETLYLEEKANINKNQEKGTEYESLLLQSSTEERKAAGKEENNAEGSSIVSNILSK